MLHVCHTVGLYVCLLVCLSVCLSVCVYVCLSVCLSVYAAKKREEKKCKKYNNERLPGDTSSTFTPLVLDDFGHWDSATESLLSELAKKSRHLEGNKLCRVQERLEEAHISSPLEVLW